MKKMEGKKIIKEINQRKQNEIKKYKNDNSIFNTIILINYSPSCISVRNSTPRVHYPQLN